MCKIKILQRINCKITIHMKIKPLFLRVIYKCLVILSRCLRNPGLIWRLTSLSLIPTSWNETIWLLYSWMRLMKMRSLITSLRNYYKWKITYWIRKEILLAKVNNKSSSLKSQMESTSSRIWPKGSNQTWTFNKNIIISINITSMLPR